MNCAALNCENPVGNKGAKGYCPKHYKRFRRGTDVNFDLRAPLSVRYDRKVNRLGPDECWEWLGVRDADGYGSITDKAGQCQRAHRVAWLLNYGVMPSSGVQVCHTCDNPPCQNPAHLFLGTNADNVADKVRKGRARGNETGHLGDLQRRLTDDQVEAIRAFGKPYYGAMADLARQYGISGEHVRRIQNGTRR